jgi:hypothetical protein
LYATDIANSLILRCGCLRLHWQGTEPQLPSRITGVVDQAVDTVRAREHFRQRDFDLVAFADVGGEADRAIRADRSEGFESVDMIVWNTKKYRHKPLLCSALLCDGDGFYCAPSAARWLAVKAAS